MLESSPFRTLFPSRRFAGCKTLLKSPRQHFYSKSSLMWDTLSWRTSLLVRSEVLGLFANALTANHRYSCHHFREISATSSNTIISKTKNILCIFYSLFSIYNKFCSFLKQSWASQLKYFGSYWLREIWLLECPKDPLWKHPSRVNVLTSIKHC